MSADTLLTVEDCLRAVRDLRQEVAELRHQLGTEVRTRRLVVVDREGRERVVAQVYEDSCSAELLVQGDHCAIASLSASSNINVGERGSADLDLIIGDGAASWSARAIAKTGGRYANAVDDYVRPR